MAKFKIGVLGLPSAQSFLFGMANQSVDAAGYALYQMAQDVLTAAKKITPRDTGALVGSAFSTKPKVSHGVVSLEIGFNTSYALYVHEIPDPPVAHNKPKGAQYKYLSTPYEQYQFKKMFQKYSHQAMMTNKRMPTRTTGTPP